MKTLPQRRNRLRLRALMLGGTMSICFTNLQKSINVIRYLQGINYVRHMNQLIKFVRHMNIWYRYDREQKVRTYWETTWAMAAPLTPKRRENIRIGSKMMLVTSPITALLEEYIGIKLMIENAMRIKERTVFLAKKWF